ncbi:MAG: hypothetical protein NUV57_03850 [archaeon]|nr:hypothetical protein [archaeon]
MGNVLRRNPNRLADRPDRAPQSRSSRADSGNGDLRTAEDVRVHFAGLNGKQLSHDAIMRRTETEAARRAVGEKLKELVTPNIDALLIGNKREAQIEAEVQRKFGTNHLPQKQLTLLIMERRIALTRAGKLHAF